MILMPELNAILVAYFQRERMGDADDQRAEAAVGRRADMDILLVEPETVSPHLLHQVLEDILVEIPEVLLDAVLRRWPA